MKKHFMAGLALLLPLAITLIIGMLFLNIVTKPFASFVSEVLNQLDILNKPFFFLSAKQTLFYSSRLVTLILFFVFIFFTGFIGHRFLFRFFVAFQDQIFHRIPFFNKIYKALQEIVHTLYHSDLKNFTKVVSVPFPTKNTQTIGLLVNGKRLDKALKNQELISVFVPATPNPAMGFLLLYKPEQITHTDIKVEEALKFIISCGVIPYEGNSKVKPTDES